MQSVSMLQRPKSFTGHSLTASRPSLPRAGRHLAQPVARGLKRDSDSDTTQQQKPASLAAAAALAACLVFGSTLLPQDAEAARSSGRVGGSAGFRSAPRSAPARPSAPSSGPSRSGPTYNSYNYSAAPQLGGYGGGYGYGGGFSLFPSFTPVYGIGGGGGFFNIIAGLFVFSTVASLVRGIFRKKNNDED